MYLGFSITNFSCSESIIAPGEQVTYKFRITNTGTSIINRIVFTAETEGGSSQNMTKVYYIAAGYHTDMSFDMTTTISTSGKRYTNILYFVTVTEFNGSETYTTTQKLSKTCTLIDKRYNPRILRFELFRAYNGEKNDEGSNVLSTIQIRKAYSDTPDSFILKLYYSSSGKASSSSSSINLIDYISNLTNGIFENDLISKTFDVNEDWHFMLYFGDGYEHATSHFSIGKTSVNVHLAGKPDGKGVCFGGFCKRSDDNKPQFECHYQSRFYDSTVFEGDVSIFGNLNVSTDGKSITLGYASTLFEKYPEEGWDPKLSISGSVAHLSGMITPTGTITGGTNKTDQYIICEIPVGYAPKNIISVLQQGTGTAMWLLRVYPSNHTQYPCKVTFARYRNGDSYTTISHSDTPIPWLPFSATWIF